MDRIKENIVTIILISLIVIVLLGFGLLVYSTMDDKNNNIDLGEMPQSIQVINNTTINNKQEDINKAKDTVNIGENNSTLIEIANIFNNHDISKSMRLQGYEFDTIVTGNRITIVSSGDGVYFNVEFILDKNNILYTTIKYNAADPQITVAEALLANILLDCVGEVKGYPTGTLYKALSGDDYKNYTLEREGIEIKSIENSYDISIKVDLNNNFSFLNT